MPFPGTRLYEQLVADGTIGRDARFAADDLNVPVFARPEFSTEELIRRKEILKSMFSGLGVLFELEKAAEESQRVRFSSGGLP